MRSLRLKFFLISWPLVVAAIAMVGLAVDRFSKIEVERIEAGPPPQPPGRGEAWAEAIGRDWPPSDATLARLAAASRPHAELLVLTPAGDRVAATRASVTAAVEPGGEAHVTVREESGGTIAQAEFVLAGTPVTSASGDRLGRLYVVPSPPGPPAWPSRLRRTMWTAALAASVAAAAAAFLLAGPLVRRVRRLTEASEAIGRGALDARVGARGDDELARLGRSFDAMAGTLERAEAHKRNLVSDVAHELRTPLTNVIAILESIQDGLRPASPEMLSLLRNEAALLASLVDELQELSLAESGQLALQLEAVDAVALARSAVEAIRPSSDAALSGPDDGAPIWVRADVRRLAQVLRNLLRNAITHTPSGGRVTVTVAAAGPRVAIAVADTGRGIPPEHLDLIWERFHRVDPSRDRASGGMGIGLALVRQLVVAMGGSVQVESEIDRGSTFRVELPSP